MKVSSCLPNRILEVEHLESFHDRGSSPGSGPTRCSAESGGPTTVIGLEGIVLYTPIPNTRPCNEAHCFHAGTRCTSSSPQASEGASTPGAVRLHSAVMHFYMMLSLGRAYRPHPHLNLNAVSSPSWWSRRRQRLRSLLWHRPVVSRPVEGALSV